MPSAQPTSDAVQHQRQTNEHLAAMQQSADGMQPGANTDSVQQWHSNSAHRASAVDSLADDSAARAAAEAEDSHQQLGSDLVAAKLQSSGTTREEAATGTKHMQWPQPVQHICDSVSDLGEQLLDHSRAGRYAEHA